MAEIVMAYSAAHAPMMTADPGSAPRQQADNFFSALEKVRDTAVLELAEWAIPIQQRHQELVRASSLELAAEEAVAS